MSESRDSNDPRDAMRGMRKETEEDLERAEAGQTGGQEHAGPADRQGVRPHDELEASVEKIAELGREQSDADALRVPRGDPVTGGGGNMAGGPPSTAEDDETGRGRS